MRDYLDFGRLLHLVPESEQALYLVKLFSVQTAMGSNHNHQAWVGGYLDHVRETMNVAIWLYETSPRDLPFTLGDALLVMLLHDAEKPFKGVYGPWPTKQDRRDFRDSLIRNSGIVLTQEQENALRYVEGEYDDYSNTERKMGELAAFCHCCDILSARLWHDKGRERDW